MLAAVSRSKRFADDSNNNGPDAQRMSMVGECSGGGSVPDSDAEDLDEVLPLYDHDREQAFALLSLKVRWVSCTVL